MVKVASYNIRKGIGTDRLRRPERILDVLAEIDADVVAIQEADRRYGGRASALPLELIANQSDYEPVAFDTRPDSIGWHGNAILVKRSHMVLRHAILEIPCIEPRGAVVADIAIRGKQFRVVGMHLDLSGLRRRLQVRSILHQISGKRPEMPTILLGDLNEWSRQGGCLTEFVGTHHVAHTGPSFHSRRPVARLDRIMVSHDLHFENAGTHHSIKARRASDHLPVWAQISFA
jgi:endonuclease/exonuclease/phosphatase family metal-dependent hydrolase